MAACSGVPNTISIGKVDDHPKFNINVVKPINSCTADLYGDKCHRNMCVPIILSISDVCLLPLNSKYFIVNLYDIGTEVLALVTVNEVRHTISTDHF